MKIQCPCGNIVEVSDSDVRSYIGALMGSGCSEAKRAALTKNAKLPRGKRNK